MGLRGEVIVNSTVIRVSVPVNEQFIKEGGKTKVIPGYNLDVEYLVTQDKGNGIFELTKLRSNEPGTLVIFMDMQEIARKLFRSRSEV